VSSLRGNARTADTYLTGFGLSGGVVAAIVGVFLVMVAAIATFDSLPSPAGIFSGGDSDADRSQPASPASAVTSGGAGSEAGSGDQSKGGSSNGGRDPGSEGGSNGGSPPGGGGGGGSGNGGSGGNGGSSSLGQTVTDTVTGVSDTVKGVGGTVDDTVKGLQNKGNNGVGNTLKALGGN